MLNLSTIINITTAIVHCTMYNNYILTQDFSVACVENLLRCQVWLAIVMTGT